MKSVGIVTIQSMYNYGNRLQNYATTYIYESMGFNVESLKFSIRYPSTQLKLFIKKALGRYTPSPDETMSAERLGAFSQFNRHLKIVEVKRVEDIDLEKYALFSVGSDQIWAMSGNPRDEYWEFLEFVPESKRIALAPSFGVSSLNDDQMNRLASHLRGFSAISVREEDGAKLIERAIGKVAQVICDPTLVLDASTWRNISDGRLNPSEPFVFAYILGDISPEVESALNLATSGGKYPVVMLSDKERKGEIPAGPAEFLSLVDHARHVVTDSFHGSVFSAIFETPLTIVHRTGGGAVYSQMFGRLESLSRKLGLDQKIYNSSNFDFTLSGDYRRTKNAISNERRKFMTYLEECISALS